MTLEEEFEAVAVRLRLEGRVTPQIVEAWRKFVFEVSPFPATQAVYMAA